MHNDAQNLQNVFSNHVIYPFHPYTLTTTLFAPQKQVVHVQTAKQSPDADLFLKSCGRKRKVITGDGNCFYRSLSYILYSHQDSHGHIRGQLADLVELNPTTFQTFVWQGDVQDHVRHMREEGIWATQVEIAAAASYLGVPVFSCIPNPLTQHYYWVQFKPQADLKYPPNKLEINLTAQHIELCNTSGIPFEEETSHSYVDLT